MISELRISGLRTLRDVAVPLTSGVTVMIGANNAGKSNVLLALRLLSAAVTGDLQKTVDSIGGWETVLARPGDGSWMISVTGDYDNHRVTFEFGLDAKREYSGAFHERLYLYQRGQQPKEPLLERHPTQGLQVDGSSYSGGQPGQALDYYARNSKSKHPAVLRLHEDLKGIYLSDLSVASLRTPSSVTRDPQVFSDGSNLAAVLDWLQVTNPDARDRIDTEVCGAATEVRKVVTAPARTVGQKVLAVVEHGGTVFTSEEMSDGLLLFIGLSTVAQLGSSRPTLIAIEEPERGVHPRRLRELLDQLRRVSARGTQVLLTTHSPTLLDEFRDAPESVLVVERDETGTKVTRLIDLPAWEAIEGQDKPLGDLWYSGVLGGIPHR